MARTSGNSRGSSRSKQSKGNNRRRRHRILALIAAAAALGVWLWQQGRIEAEQGERLARLRAEEKHVCNYRWVQHGRRTPLMEALLRMRSAVSKSSAGVPPAPLCPASRDGWPTL